MPSSTGQLSILGISFVLYFTSQHVEGPVEWMLLLCSPVLLPSLELQEVTQALSEENGKEMGIDQCPLCLA